MNPNMQMLQLNNMMNQHIPNLNIRNQNSPPNFKPNVNNDLKSNSKSSLFS